MHSVMDNMAIPRKLFDDIEPHIPPSATRWSHIWQWTISAEVPESLIRSLRKTQMQQFRLLLKYTQRKQDEMQREGMENAEENP